MGKELVLILNVSGTSSLSAQLQRILATDFTVVADRIRSHEHATSSDLVEALGTVVQSHDPYLIFLVSQREALDVATEFVVALTRSAPGVPVIAAIEGCAPDQAFELLRFGAADFITTPFHATDVLPRAWRLLNQNRSPTPADTPNYHVKQLIGESPVFLEEVDKIELISSCDANVLIIGETGTGKELYARAIHYGSARAGKPFMPVNCGAIPVELVENELFGHTRGAFTSASTLQVGLIEEANGGTLFLDEIDCLPIFAQVKLLRFLQEKEYRPLGSPKMRRADVRIIAASNVNLPDAVDAGKVRQDLFYRLNIISLNLPPLRDRCDDIPLLTRHFLTKYTRESQKRITRLSDEALHLLMTHSWPGNVRELEHVIERAVVLCQSEVIHHHDVLLTNSSLTERRESLQEAKAKEIARFEKSYIQGVLSICRGNITKAAQVAQKNRRAFWQLIQKHGIDVQRFKSADSV
jgi:two-component system, NtrC family, response regulator GlrR